MTTPTGTELAEYVAGLLKELWLSVSSEDWFLSHHNIYERTNKEDLEHFIFDSEFAPIIRHLIEEEMEERGYKVSMSPQDKKYGHFYTIKKWSIEVAGAYNPSKTKAVALAAYRTGEK